MGRAVRCVCVVLLLSACGGSPGGDGGVVDAPLPPGDGADPLCVPGTLAASGPVAYVLSGSAETAAWATSLGPPYRTVEETVVAYFPGGTADGATMIVAHPIGWPHGGLTTSSTRLAGGRAHFSFAGSFEQHDFEVEGDVVIDAGVANVVVSRNFAWAGTDVGDLGEGPGVLCRTSIAPPAPTLSLASSVGVVLAPLSPLGVVRVASPVPVAADAVFTVRALGSDVAVTDTRDTGTIDLRARTAFPPNAPLVLGVTGTDALGRPLMLDVGAIEVWVTTAVLTDLTLETEPPPGAMVGQGLTWASGEVRLEAGRTVGLYATAVVLALGAPPPGTTLARVTFGPGFGFCPATEVHGALVGPTGATSEISVCDAPGPSERTVSVTLPETGALHLVLAIDATPSRPQSHPGGTIQPPAIRGIAFE